MRSDRCVRSRWQAGGWRPCFRLGAWARKLADRRLPRGSLSKVASVEVAAVSPEERDLLVEGATVKLWVGVAVSYS